MRKFANAFVDIIYFRDVGIPRFFIEGEGDIFEES